MAEAIPPNAIFSAPPAAPSPSMAGPIAASAGATAAATDRIASSPLCAERNPSDEASALLPASCASWPTFLRFCSASSVSTSIFLPFALSILSADFSAESPTLSISSEAPSFSAKSRNFISALDIGAPFLLLELPVYVLLEIAELAQRQPADVPGHDVQDLGEPPDFGAALFAERARGLFEAGGRERVVRVLGLGSFGPVIV